MNKENLVHIYNRILLSHKKIWNIAICNNMDWSWDYHAKQNKLDIKSQEPYDSTHIWDIKVKATNKQKEQTNKKS